MRNVSLAGLQSLLAEETASVWLFGVSFHPNEAEDYPDSYFCSNTVDISFAGQTYTALPFEVTLAADSEETVPQARLRIDNVSRGLSEAIRQTTQPPTVNLRIFRIDGAGTVHLELGPSRFTLLSATVTALTVEGVLGYESDFLNEPAVHQRFTPSIAPALFS